MIARTWSGSTTPARQHAYTVEPEAIYAPTSFDATVKHWDIVQLASTLAAQSTHDR